MIPEIDMFAIKFNDFRSLETCSTGYFFADDALVLSLDVSKKLIDERTVVSHKNNTNSPHCWRCGSRKLVWGWGGLKKPVTG